MPLHDWTRVEACRFHSFHTRWIAHLSDTLNAGILPPNYYADPEQVTSSGVPDVLTLRTPGVTNDPPRLPSGLAVAEHPPRTQRSRTFARPALRPRSRHVTIRHASGDQVVAFIEIVSPANKDWLVHVEDFAHKVAAALEQGVHVLVLDLLPPGRHDPNGMSGAIARELGVAVAPVVVATPMTFVSYAAGTTVREDAEALAVGMCLPEMPLFLTAEHYVAVPLEPTYQFVWERSPAWRRQLES
jgi:hypothetical protein